MRQQSGPPLSDFEYRVFTPRKGKSWPIRRQNVVLLWLNESNPQWFPENRVRSQFDCADWLEDLYRNFSKWTRFDPNRVHSQRNGAWSRLIYINGGPDMGVAAHWINTGKRGERPFVEYKDWCVGTEDWYRILIHETAHDFCNGLNPAWAPSHAVWGESVANYFIHPMLLAFGMDKAAARYEERIKASRPTYKYDYGAWLILQHQRKLGIKDGDAGALWAAIAGRDLTNLLGKPAWA